VDGLNGVNPYPDTLDLLRTALALCMLGYGGIRDLRTREVHDLLWVVSGAAGLLLDVYELFLGTLGLTQLVYAVGAMAVFALILGVLRLMGEADLLAFVALVLIHPRAPVYIGVNTGWSPLFFPFTLVSNVAIAGVLTPLITALLNASLGLRGVSLFQGHQGLPLHRKLILILTARYVKLEQVRGPPFEYPLEGGGGLRLRPDIWDDEAASRAFEELRLGAQEWTWVSATLPYLVVMAGGYVLSVVFGDVIFLLLFRLL